MRKGAGGAGITALVLEKKACSFGWSLLQAVFQCNEDFAQLTYSCLFNSLAVSSQLYVNSKKILTTLE